MPLPDGGIVAISGYLYQMLAVAGMRAWGESPEGASPRHDALLAVARRAEIRHEAFGQDAALLPSSLQPALSRGPALVQIKYSEKGMVETIGDGDLIDIANALERSSKTLKAETGDDVSSYFLVTNRSLSPNAQALLPKVHGGKPPAVVGKKSKKRVSAEARGVLDALEFHDVGSGSWTDALERFAQRYGVLPGEMAAGIERLMARIFLGTQLSTHRGEVTLTQLRECLVGSGNARSLVRSEQHEQAGRELQRLGASVYEGHHVPREALSDIEEACGGHALVVFYGRGGAGKSASLNNWAQTVAAKEDGPFLRADRAARIAPHWLENTIQEWRDLPYADRGSLQEVQARLEAANPNLLPPLLMVALDGVDERLGDEGRHSLERIVAALCEKQRLQLGVRPTMRLVVTCREREEFEGLLPEESNSGFFTTDRKDRYHSVAFGDFTDREFEELVEREVPNYKKELLPARPHRLAAPGIGCSLDPGSAPFGGDPPHSPRRLLRDPAVWRAFLLLSDANKAGLLRSEENAMIALGSKLVERFSDRAQRRHKWRLQDIQMVLHGVAREMEAKPPPWRKADWLEFARSIGCFGREGNDELFDEALSGGLIDGSSHEWRWRNDPVRKYLLSR